MLNAITNFMWNNRIFDKPKKIEYSIPGTAEGKIEAERLQSVFIEAGARTSFSERRITSPDGIQHKPHFNVVAEDLNNPQCDKIFRKLEEIKADHKTYLDYLTARGLPTFFKAEGMFLKRFEF